MNFGGRFQEGNQLMTLPDRMLLNSGLMISVGNVEVLELWGMIGCRWRQRGVTIDIERNRTEQQNIDATRLQPDESRMKS